MNMMKKRLLSAFLCLCMALTLLPTVAITASAANMAVSSVQLGDYVKVGEYNGSSMLWRCVAFEKVTGNDANGNPIIDSTATKTAYAEGYLPLMLADTSICQKEFDKFGSVTTGSHNRHGDRFSGGSNYWGDSNIRDWLNSSADSVTWSCGNSPSYASEKGFLTNFDNAEKAAIKTVTQKSLLAEPDKDISGATGNAAHTYKYEITNLVANYADAYSEQITDKMFLLDVQQAKNVYDNYNDYYKLSVDYWLRSPVGPDNSNARYVTSSGIVGLESARYSHAVRPAFFLDPAATLEGTGTQTAPYTLAAPTPAHSHAVSVGCETDSGGQVEFTEWKSGDFNGTFPSAPGNYALAENVEIRSDTWVISSDVINLCLNGHTLNMTNGGYILLNGSDAKLNICDCSEHGSGSIKSVSSSLHAEAISITNSKSTLNLYGGNIHAEFNGTSGVYAYGVDAGSASINIYGGQITAESSSTKAVALNISSNTPRVKIYGGILTAKAPEGQGEYGLYLPSLYPGWSSYSIEGGVYIGRNSIGIGSAAIPIKVTGGIFSTDPTGVIDPGYTARKITSSDPGYQAEYAGYYVLEPASAQPAHTHGGVTFTAWNRADSLPDVEGNYYLTTDVTLASTWQTPEGKTVNLCLNGHSITGPGGQSPVHSVC